MSYVTLKSLKALVYLQDLRQAGREDKRRPLIAVLEAHPQTSQIAHVTEALRACGKKNQKKPGLYRCKLPICPRCAQKAGVKQTQRAQALMASVASMNPDKEYLSLTTINASHQDMSQFRRELTRSLRGTQFTGVMSISLQGKLHAHIVVSHDPVSREVLVNRLKKHFPEPSAVNALEVKQERTLDGVSGFLGYAYAAIKSRDSRRTSSWSVNGLFQWALAQDGLTGSRRIEGGFTKQERVKARSLVSEFKPTRKKSKRKLNSIFLSQLKQEKVKTCEIGNDSTLAVTCNQGNVKSYQNRIRTSIQELSDLESKTSSDLDSSIHSVRDSLVDTRSSDSVDPLVDTRSSGSVDPLVDTRSCNHDGFKNGKCKTEGGTSPVTGSLGTTSEQTPEERTDRIVERLLSQLRKSRIDQKQGVLAG